MHSARRASVGLTPRRAVLGERGGKRSDIAILSFDVTFPLQVRIG
jgi:hypothetical protein